MPGFPILARCALVTAMFFLTVTGMPLLSPLSKVPLTFERTRGACGPGEYFMDMPEVRCLPCPSDHFQNETAHSYRQCKPCRPSAPNSAEVLISKCSSSHDAVFLCRGGFFRKFDAIAGDSCVACSECGVSDPSAPIMAAPCGLYSDTLCCRTERKHFINGTWECGAQGKEEEMAGDHGRGKSEHTKTKAFTVLKHYRNNSSNKNDSIVDADVSKKSESHPGSSWREDGARMSDEAWALRVAGVFFTIGSLGMLGCVLFTKVFLENRHSLTIAFGCDPCPGHERRQQGDWMAYGTFPVEQTLKVSGFLRKI